MKSGCLMLAMVGVVVVGAAGASVRAAESRVLRQGPVLGGGGVVWAEQAGVQGELHLWSPSAGERVVYRSEALALGQSLAASGSLLAFERSYPGCPPQPGRACPQLRDALVGPPAGPFQPLARPRKCVVPDGNALAADGSVVAYLELDCVRQRVRLVVRDVAGGGAPRVLRESDLASGCCEVVIAGRYVAWTGDRSGEIVVYDRRAARVSYRARVAAAGSSARGGLGFDVQADGKLAVVYHPSSSAGSPTAIVVWFSPAGPRRHVLPLRARDARARIAGDRLAFVQATRAGTSALVLTDLAGHVQTVAQLGSRARLHAFDLDRRHLTWATDRIKSTREDCPPPGSERPCLLRETGTTAIWIRAVPAGSPRLVAELAFADVPARP